MVPTIDRIARNTGRKALALAMLFIVTTAACSSGADAPGPPNLGDAVLDDNAIDQRPEPQLVVAPVTGKEGPQGRRGPQGVRGLQGLTGAQGPPGPAALAAASQAPEYDFAIYEPSYTSIGEGSTTVAEIVPSAKERLLFLNFEAQLRMLHVDSAPKYGVIYIDCFLRAEGMSAYVARVQLGSNVNRSGGFRNEGRLDSFTLQGVLPAGRAGQVECTLSSPGIDDSVTVSASVWLRSAMALAGNTNTPGLLVVDAQYPWLEDQRLCDEGNLPSCVELRSWAEDGSPLRAYAQERIDALTP
jgi:hypothetical protein